MYCNYRGLHSIHWFGFKMGQTSYNQMKIPAHIVEMPFILY